MKTIRIPYKKIHNYILIKEIIYDLRKRYKKVTHAYEEYKDGNLINIYKHRIGKPAIIIYRNNHISEIQYWKYGKLHREHGPAIIIYDGMNCNIEKWYKNGLALSEEDIEHEKKIINRRKKMIKLILKMKKS